MRVTLPAPSGVGGTASSSVDAVRGPHGRSAAVAADGRAELRLLRSSLLFMEGRATESVAEAVAALAEPGIGPERRAEAALAELLGLAALDDFGQARSRAEAILAGRSGAGDASLAGAITALGFIGWHDGRVADSLGLIRAAIARLGTEANEPSRAYPRLLLASFLGALGDFDGADAAAALAAAEIESNSDCQWAAGPGAVRARNCLAAGHLDDAVVLARAAIATAELGGHVFAPAAQLTLATAALLSGDVDDAAQQVRALRTGPAAARVLFGSALYTWVQARVVEAQRGTAASVEMLGEVYDDPTAHRRLFVEEPAAAAWMVRAALDVGEPQLAKAIATSVEQLGAENRGVASVTAGATHACGLIARDARQILEAAAAQDLRWARASALEDAGALLDAAGDPNGRQHLERAEQCYHAVGATRDAGRVATRLRRSARGTDRPVTGWGSLTAAERRVARVVAEGLSNAQVGERMFLSRHTVDFHLRQIFRKLTIHSRVELTRRVIECDGELLAG